MQLKIPPYVKVLLSLLTLFAAINVVFYLWSPDDIVAAVGIENSYLVVFCIAAIGGLSSFTSGVLYAAIATFAAGGSIPWLLGIAAGIGISIGDSLVFAVIRYGTKNISAETRERVLRFRHYVDIWPSWLQYTVLYFLLGFTPLPNDILIAGLVVFGYKLQYVYPVILAGGITIATLTAYLGESFWF